MAPTSSRAPDPAGEPDALRSAALPSDVVGLLEGLMTTRAIRRYRDEPVPHDVLRAVLFAATRAPSGSNRQAFRFVVLEDGDRARRAKALIAGAAQQAWRSKVESDDYERGTGTDEDSRKARVARTMQQYVDSFASVPVVILACLDRYREPNPTEGASVYPACQNLLLAARALGYGGVLTTWHGLVEEDLRAILEIPEHVLVAATISLGRPLGSHGPVRRRPLREFVFDDVWGAPASWAIDPPGVGHTSGPFLAS